MTSVALKNGQGQETGRLELAAGVFEAPIKPIVMREALNQYLANQRQGTHDTKTRQTVSGGGKKPWKQKHTGRARQGSIRAFQWRHGAIAHGPHPRDYSYDIPREKKRVALRSALASYAKDNAITVLESLPVSGTPKTKTIMAFLGTLGIADKKVLFVTDVPNETLIRSARNIPGVKVTVVNSLNIFDLCYYDHVVFTRQALDIAQETFKP